jgi:choline dehydrogenase-like flavoprotein
VPRADVVVVGAGAAGAVLAARLCDDPTRRVILLEAGSAPSYRGLDPFRALSVPDGSWADVAAVHVDGRPAQPYVQGRGVGGSTAVNGMLAEWPLAIELDAWGVPGWSAAALAPAMAAVASRLALRAAPTLGPLNAAMLRAAEDAGLTVLRPRFTSDGRQRVSVADAFLRRAQDRLIVRTGAEVAAVLLDGRRATGVRLVSGEEIEAGEVVLSAGAIHTPLLLMRSGIERRGIGRHLQDHPAVQVGVDLGAPGRVIDGERLPFGIAIRHESLLILPMDHTGDPARGGVIVALLDARSRGSVAADDGGARIRFGQLADERDRDALTRGLSLAVELLSRPHVRRLVTALDVPAVSDIGGVYHAAGTCRIGGREDDDAVVDSDLRVVGYDGLRVADASVMPLLPTAAPMLTCAVIGAHAASRW